MVPMAFELHNMLGELCVTKILHHKCFVFEGFSRFWIKCLAYWNKPICGLDPVMNGYEEVVLNAKKNKKSKY